MSFGTCRKWLDFISTSKLIKFCIRDDFDNALDEYDRSRTERRTAPWITNLAARLIENDDMTRLERLMRMNAAVFGERNGLFDLSLAFLRCQRVNDAKSVLEVYIWVYILIYIVYKKIL